MRAALHHRRFRHAAGLYACDALLEWLGSIALMALVYRATGSATMAAAMLLCKQVAPGLLVSPVGRAVDRVGSHGAVLAVGFTMQALALLAIAGTGFGAALFPLAVVTGTAGAIVRSTLRTVVAVSFPDERLRGGNAILNLAAAGAALAGPAAGASLVSAIGPAPSLIVASVLVLVAAATASLLPAQGTDPEHDAAHTASEPHGPIPRSPTVPVSWLLLLIGVLSCVFVMDDPALLAFSEQSLDAGVGGYGAIFSAWGLGAGVGGLVFARLLHWPMLRVYALGTVLVGIAYLGLGAAPSITVACGLAVVGGIGNGMDSIALVTAIQEATPLGSEASVARRLEAVTAIGPGFGLLLGGLLADLASPRLSLLVPGAMAFLILACGISATRLARRPRGTSTFIPSIHGGSV